MKIDQKARHIEDLFLFIGLFSLFSVSFWANKGSFQQFVITEKSRNYFFSQIILIFSHLKNNFHFLQEKYRKNKILIIFAPALNKVPQLSWQSKGLKILVSLVRFQLVPHRKPSEKSGGFLFNRDLKIGKILVSLFRPD